MISTDLEVAGLWVRWGEREKGREIKGFKCCTYTRNSTFTVSSQKWRNVCPIKLKTKSGLWKHESNPQNTHTYRYKHTTHYLPGCLRLHYCQWGAWVKPGGLMWQHHTTWSTATSAQCSLEEKHTKHKIENWQSIHAQRQIQLFALADSPIHSVRACCYMKRIMIQF